MGSDIVLQGLGGWFLIYCTHTVVAMFYAVPTCVYGRLWQCSYIDWCLPVDISFEIQCSQSCPICWDVWYRCMPLK